MLFDASENPQFLGGLLSPPTPGTVTAITASGVKTRTKAIYANSDVSPAEIVAMRPAAVTPAKAGNHIELTWFLTYESNNHNGGFYVTKNIDGAGDVILDGSGSTTLWELLAPYGYDTDDVSTLHSNTITITDENTSALSTVYKIWTRPSAVTSANFYLNRTVSSAGSSVNENGLSTFRMKEITI